MIPPEELRLFEQDVWLAVELTLQDRTRDGYLVLDSSLAAVEAAAGGDWTEALADLYRRAMADYVDAHGFDTLLETSAVQDWSPRMTDTAAAESERTREACCVGWELS